MLTISAVHCKYDGGLLVSLLHEQNLPLGASTSVAMLWLGPAARLLWLGCCGSAVVGAPLASRCSGFTMLWERRLRRDALALLC